MHNPASPGELRREFLGERTVNELAAHSGGLNGRTAVTVELSIRLGLALNLSPEFFSRAQLQYDHWLAAQKKRAKIKPLAA